MNTTLSERLKEAMHGPPKVSGVELAKACGVSRPSVSGWRTGDSKSLDGKNLLAASKKLGVRPEWLASGTGPKYQTYVEPEHVPKISETVRHYPSDPIHKDKWIAEAVKIMKSMRPSQREGAVAALRTHVQNLGPHHNGQSLPMAVK